LVDHSLSGPWTAKGLISLDTDPMRAFLLLTVSLLAPALGIAAPAKTAPGDTTAPGWITLEGDQFLNVNCHDDTWRRDGGHAWCTGKPTGVIRYREPLVNFEFTCEWMHKRKGDTLHIEGRYQARR